MDFFGPFSLGKQAGNNPPKNPPKNPRFSRQLFDQNPLREISALKRISRVCSPKPLLEASETGVGLDGASFFLREMTESRQKREGETYRRLGGPKTFSGRGFTPIDGMFSIPLSFPPPLAAL